MVLLNDLRVCSVKPVFLPIVDVEHSSTSGPILCQIFDHVKQNRNTHSIISCTRSCCDRVVMGREQHASAILILFVRAVDLYQDIGSLEIHSKDTTNRP